MVRHLHSKRLKKWTWRWGTGLYGLAVIASTMFIKQHAIIDVLDDMAEKFADIEDELCDVEDGLDAVSDDLSDVEERCTSRWRTMTRTRMKTTRKRSAS